MRCRLGYWNSKRKCFIPTNDTNKQRFQQRTEKKSVIIVNKIMIVRWVTDWLTDWLLDWQTDWLTDVCSHIIAPNLHEELIVNEYRCFAFAYLVQNHDPQNPLRPFFLFVWHWDSALKKFINSLIFEVKWFCETKFSKTKKEVKNKKHRMAILKCMLAQLSYTINNHCTAKTMLLSLRIKWQQV